MSLFLFHCSVYLSPVDNLIVDNGSRVIVLESYEKDNRKLLDNSLDTEAGSTETESYSPYPSNFMVPKGVCEKSEPVMIINK